MLKLTPQQRSGLRAQAHSLNPVVMIGSAGLTDAVLKEISVSLDAHELVKIRVFEDERETRAEIMEAICNELDAAPVQHIGKLLVVYRPKKEEASGSKARGNPGLKPAVTYKPGFGAVRNRVKKVLIKGNERVTQGGLIKRKKARQASAKKKALAT